MKEEHEILSISICHITLKSKLGGDIGPKADYILAMSIC